MTEPEFTTEERQQLLDRIAELEDERNRRLHAEEAMAKAHNRVDRELARMLIFQEFITEALENHDKETFIERSLEIVIEAFETEAAAFFIADSEETFRLVGRFGLDDLNDGLTVSLSGHLSEKAVLINDHPNGESIAASLKLQDGMFCSYKGIETDFGGLLVTGNSPSGIGLYRQPIPDHLSSFSILSAQVGAMWKELLFMEEKEAYTHHLEDRVEERTIELKEAQEHFQQLLEAAPDGFIVINENGEIVLANAQAETIFGYAKEQMIGKPVEIFLPPELRERHVAQRHSYFRAPKIRGMGKHIDLEACRADGSTFPIEISLSPIKTSQGMQTVAAIRDITERKEAEEELSQNMDALERFRNLVFGRETRMIRLKEEINTLLMKLGKESKYKIVDKQDTDVL